MAVMGDDDTLDAGAFGAWLDRAAVLAPADVPCGDCSACCTASQFVLVEPDEHAALAVIPPALLFPAPRRPEGFRLLGYDEHGACPMFVDERCSIYEHRPRACRVYDCRVYAAAGVEPPDPGVAVRVRRWRFSYPGPADEQRHAAVRAKVPGGVGPTEAALTAICDREAPP
jgi:hypothetical protein